MLVGVEVLSFQRWQDSTPRTQTPLCAITARVFPFTLKAWRAFEKKIWVFLFFHLFKSSRAVHRQNQRLQHHYLQQRSSSSLWWVAKPAQTGTDGDALVPPVFSKAQTAEEAVKSPLAVLLWCPHSSTKVKAHPIPCVLLPGQQFCCHSGSRKSE